MKTSFFLILFFFISLGLTAQEKIYMPYFEVINIHSDYQLSASRLLKTYLELDGKAELVLPVKDSTLYRETKEQAFASASSKGIDLVLIAEMNRAGETVILSFALYKLSGGQKIWSAIQKAAGPDDLDPVLQKIAKAIILREKPGAQEDIFNVSDYTSKQLNRQTANTYWGLQIGGAVAMLGGKNYSPAGFGIIYSGDGRSLFYDIKGLFYFGDMNMTSIGIDVNYPLLSKSSSPYFGGGISYGSSNPNKDNDVGSGKGLSIQANGGYLLNRTSNVNLRINASLFYSLYTVNGNNPAGIMIGAAVLF